MTDPFFSKSVVYICEHNQQGAMGIIINKQFKVPELKEKVKMVNTILGSQPINDKQKKKNLKSVYLFNVMVR